MGLCEYNIVYVSYGFYCWFYELSEFRVIIGYWVVFFDSYFSGSVGSFCNISYCVVDVFVNFVLYIVVKCVDGIDYFYFFGNDVVVYFFIYFVNINDCCFFG